jgi:hypothetical protein
MAKAGVAASSLADLSRFLSRESRRAAPPHVVEHRHRCQKQQEGGEGQRKQESHVLEPERADDPSEKEQGDEG